MGFGLKGLKILRNVITEIAAENGMSVENNEAIRRFLFDVENHYDDYLLEAIRLKNIKSRFVYGGSSEEYGL